MLNQLTYPLKIGITGGIGSGKTTVTKILKTLGVPIFNSDEYGKKLLTSNEIVIRKIIENFGKDIISKNKIDTQKLGKIVFSNKKKLELLNNIIHPQVFLAFNNWLLQQKTKYIIKESAILFESNIYKRLDKIILIKAPVSLRIKRVSKRDQRSVSEIQKIIKNQVSIDKIVKYADYIVNNNEKSLLTPKIIKIHEEVLSNL